MPGTHVCSLAAIHHTLFSDICLGFHSCSVERVSIHCTAGQRPGQQRPADVCERRVGPARRGNISFLNDDRPDHTWSRLPAADFQFHAQHCLANRSVWPQQHTGVLAHLLRSAIANAVAAAQSKTVHVQVLSLTLLAMVSGVSGSIVEITRNREAFRDCCVNAAQSETARHQSGQPFPTTVSEVDMLL